MQESPSKPAHMDDEPTKQDYGQILRNLVAMTEAQRLDEYQRHCNMLVHQLAADVRERYSPKLCTIAAFQLHGNEKAKQRVIVEQVRKVEVSLEARTKAGKGAVFHGPCGTGKDHMAIALMYQACWKYAIPCRWVLGVTLYRTISDSWKDSSKRQQVLGPFLKPGILCISDALPPGRDSLEPFKAEALYEIIGQRNAMLKPTWATLNVPSQKEADRRLTEPVWDRLRQGAIVLEFAWESYRQPE